ncbi:hypothetical protein ACX3P1_15560 [Mesorhizobium sp. A623]
MQIAAMQMDVGFNALGDQRSPEPVGIVFSVAEQSFFCWQYIEVDRSDLDGDQGAAVTP